MISSTLCILTEMCWNLALLPSQWPPCDKQKDQHFMSSVFTGLYENLFVFTIESLLRAVCCLSVIFDRSQTIKDAVPEILTFLNAEKQHSDNPTCLKIRFPLFSSVGKIWVWRFVFQTHFIVIPMNSTFVDFYRYGLFLLFNYLRRSPYVIFMWQVWSTLYTVWV